MKIICIGRNYLAHINELHNKVPQNPVIFLKPDTAIPQKKMPFFIPKFTDDIHFEAELVIRINKNGKNISERFARKYFEEITIGIDFTARSLQNQLKQKGLPWELAKSFDGSAPIGEFIPVSELASLTEIDFRLEVNGTTRQTGNSRNMIYPIEKIISFVSGYFTLKKGDMIFTGTPEGVGAVHKGDKLEGYIGDKKLLMVHVR